MQPPEAVHRGGVTFILSMEAEFCAAATTYTAPLPNVVWQMNFDQSVDFVDGLESFDNIGQTQSD